jgi:hypothetical protein
MKNPMEKAKTIPLDEEPCEDEELAQKILTMRAADIRLVHYVSLPKPRRFFRERFEKFWGYKSEINELFDRLFPGMDTLVMYRYPSGFSGHIFIKKPNEQNPYYVLFTAGMSHAPMRIPKSLKGMRASLERAELLMFLSPKFSLKGLLNEESSRSFLRMDLAHPEPWKASWFVKLGDCIDRISCGGYPSCYASWDCRALWPIAWLEKMARLPYKNHTWIYHRLMACDVGPVNTWQAGGIFLNFGQLATRNGQSINLYNCVPLYPEEVEYLHPQQQTLDEAERQVAYERILKDLPLLVDLHRPSLCPKEAKCGNILSGRTSWKEPKLSL